MRAQQTGFGFDMGTGFDTGQGQSGFNFESAYDSSRRKFHEDEEYQRAKRRREQKQREDREREERSRNDRSRSQHQHPWESPWDVLGVSYDATTRQIRAAWAAKLKACHPDLGGSVADAQRYNAAYESLKQKGGRR
jgi:hypothetical protein